MYICLTHTAMHSNFNDLKNRTMEEAKKYLLDIRFIFGVVAIALWTLRLFYEIEMIYPICCNIVQFVAIVFLYKETK